MCSTIAEAGLNFRVRNGNGCGPRSMDGGKTLSLFPVPLIKEQRVYFCKTVDPSSVSAKDERIAFLSAKRQKVDP